MAAASSKGDATKKRPAASEDGDTQITDAPSASKRRKPRTGTWKPLPNTFAGLPSDTSFQASQGRDS